MSTPITFEIGIRVQARKLLSPVKDLEDSVNDAMQGFGFSEKLCVTTLLPLEMSVERRTTPEEMKSMLEAIGKTFSEQFGPAQIEYVKEK